MDEFYKENPYTILGVSKTATKSEIKTAYRKKAKESHPDKNEGKEIPEFRKYTFAYKVLIDSEKRKAYDETGQWEEKQEPTLDDQAVTVLSVLVNRSVATVGVGIMNTDFVAFLRKSLKVDITNFKRTIHQVKTTLNIYRTLKKRIKITKEDPQNILYTLLDREIHTYTEALKNIFQNIEIRQRAVKLLENYLWDFGREIEINVKQGDK